MHYLNHFFPLFKAFILVLISASAHAFQFTPLEAEFSLQANGRMRSFEIVNVNQQPVAIELSMHHRAIDIDGNEQLSDASDEFSIYPEQIILMPEERQSIRVQWLGSEAPDKELAYRLVAQQLPVNLDESEASGIRFLLRYMASVYINPQSTTMKVEAQIIEDAGHKWLLLENSGDRHVILHPEFLVFSGTPEAAALPEPISKALDSQNLLANSQRRFSLQDWTSAQAHSLEVSFDMSKLNSN